MTVTKILLYITCLCFAREFVFCDDYRETGKDVTLTPSIRGKPEEILWKHNENKVLEYDGSEVVEYGSFRGRVVVDFETGQLTIRKLNRQDSGQYQSDIVINGKIQSFSHTLTILDALAEPRVSCELDETSNVKLLCSVESETQLSYKWSGPNINGHSGPELVVDKQEENLDSVYTCTVNNHVNSKSTDFTLKDCHTGREESAVLVPVIVIILFLILLIALAIFLYTLYKRKKQKQARPSEPKNMDPENGSSDAIATLPSHIRLHSQKESIADKKWYQDTEPEDLGETEELLKETNSLQEKNLKQSPQSDVTETNQENAGKGDGELKYEKNSKHAVEAEENTYSKPDETEKEGHKPLQSQEEEEKEKSQRLKQKSENGEKLLEHQNEGLEEQETEDNNEDNQTPGQTEEATDRADTERNMDNEAERVHENEKKSQNDDGEQSLEQQNESPRNQKTEDTANSENDMRPGEKKERTEEKNHTRIDSPNTAETCSRPSVDRPVDGKAPSAPAGQDQEEERKHPGLDRDEKIKVVSNQEEKGGQEQMPEEKNHDPAISDEIVRINFDKQTDPDGTINTVSQQQGHDDGLSNQDEAVPACPEKSDMANKNQSFTPIDNNAKVMQNKGETEAK